MSDPKTLAGAKGVATKKNNEFKKMVAEKLPLFSDELFAGWIPDTPEKVIERRRAQREGWNERLKAMVETEMRQARQWRSECRALCVDDVEFFRLMRAYIRRSKWRRWCDLKHHLTKRLQPLSETADLIFAWLEQETQPVSHWDLWRSRGDGLDWRAISTALHELLERELIIACPLQNAITDDGREIWAGGYKLPNKN